MTIRLVNPEGLPSPRTYSHVAVVTGTRLVFIAGQEPEDVTGALAGPGDLTAQPRQVFANLGVALAAAGAAGQACCLRELSLTLSGGWWAGR